jgi:hypothetical protein
LKNSNVSSAQSFSLATEIKEINKKAENSKLSWLSRILPQDEETWKKFITTIVGLLFLAYSGLQKANTPPATESPTPMPVTVSSSSTYAVSFTNPSSRATVRVILLKDGDTFDTFEIPHGKTKSKKIPQGKYDLEVQIDYPAMTPSSPDCYIQWQQTTSYTGNLVIDVDTTTVNVKQFYFEPTEICTHPTPGP